MYSVKFPWKGETKFGIHDEYSQESKALAKQGLTIVEDAVTPNRYKVPIKDLVECPRPDYKSGKWQTEADEFVEAEFEKAIALSDSLVGFVPGKLFSVSVADGRAWYLVTKVTGRSCTIEWRGFCPDRWTDHYFGYGGSFPTAKIKKYVDMGEGLFRKK